MASNSERVLEEGRICFFCEHCYLTTGHTAYSEMTPGEDFDTWCTKNHWSFKHSMSEMEFVRFISSAQTCPDYALNPSILEELNA